VINVSGDSEVANPLTGMHDFYGSGNIVFLTTHSINLWMSRRPDFGS